LNTSIGLGLGFTGFVLISFLLIVVGGEIVMHLQSRSSDDSLNKWNVFKLYQGISNHQMK
jgi:hypothetical protein